MTAQTGPLSGIRAVELGGGVGAAWCGRMLADLGATVLRAEPEGGDPLRRRREDPARPETEGLLFAWLNGAKGAADGNLDTLIEASDLLILGEGDARPAISATPRAATVDLSWFGRSGPRADWRGADVAAQALCGMIQIAGPVDGAPQQLGDLQSAMIGGVSALTAALAGLYAGGDHRSFEVGILESCMVLSELALADAQTLARGSARIGVNRFYPTCPVTIHECREGWLGITLITPDQWATFCKLLDLPGYAEDPGLATIYLRAERADEIEPAIDEKLRARTAEEWAALGREHRVPLVVVPDAGGILDHPVFSARNSIASVEGASGARGPRSPLRVSAPQGDAPALPAPDGSSPLDGLRVADFSMGWAGPLATRILADLGAEVVKIEAGRYPDWWRGTKWDAESIAGGQYEESRRFAALNRGKKSVSFDLTTEEGRRLARDLVAASHAVVENHAAGVMQRLGMGWDALSEGRDDLVMLSMSAFGSGNVWSDTRAYGSTLEQASGIPSFRGEDGWPPAMGHIAYGDPIGGIYGAAALLAALVHRRRGGAGQWINMSQVECLLPFAAPSILSRSVTGEEPRRLRNAHAAMSPHGIHPSAGEDRWVAIAVDSDAAWRRLAETVGRPDLASLSLEARRERAGEIDEAIAAWTRGRPPLEAADLLQAEGVIAAPILRPEETLEDPHLSARGVYLDLDRPHVGRQRQFSLPILEDGRRAPSRGPAPLLGGDTEAILARIHGLDAAGFRSLVEAGVVSLHPTSLRGAAAAERKAPEPAVARN